MTDVQKVIHELERSSLVHRGPVRRTHRRPARMSLAAVRPILLLAFAAGRVALRSGSAVLAAAGGGRRRPGGSLFALALLPCCLLC